MKTKIIIFLFLAIHFKAFSGDHYFVTRLGLSSMYITESQGSLSANYNSRLGFNSALGVELNLSKHISLQPELNFTNKGFKFSTSSQTIDMKLNYLELPMLFKAKMPVEDILELYGEVGPSIAIGIGGEGVINGQSYGDVFGSNGFKSFDFGLNYGAGFNFKLGTVYKLGAEIRFYKGIQNIYPANSGNFSGNNNGFITGINFSKAF